MGFASLPASSIPRQRPLQQQARGTLVHQITQLCLHTIQSLDIIYNIRMECEALLVWPCHTTISIAFVGSPSYLKTLIRRDKGGALSTANNSFPFNNRFSCPPPPPYVCLCGHHFQEIGHEIPPLDLLAVGTPGSSISVEDNSRFASASEKSKLRVGVRRAST